MSNRRAPPYGRSLTERPSPAAIRSLAGPVSSPSVRLPSQPFVRLSLTTLVTAVMAEQYY